MDKVVQKNASDSEESASAAQELSAQADEMNEMVASLDEVVSGYRSDGRQSRQEHAVESQTCHQSHPQDRTRTQTTNAGQETGRPQSRGDHAHKMISLDNDEYNDF